VARGGALVAAGDHAAGLKRGDAKGVGGFFRGPAQQFRARGGYAEGAANRARPPTARK